MIVLPASSRLLQLEAIIAAQLDGGSLRLYKNELTPTVDSILADFTVANFTGYANKTIATWGTPYLDALGLATVLGGLQTWTCTDAVTPNQIYGCYYVDAGGELIFAERFSSPIPMGSADEVLNMVPKYQVGNIEGPVL